jgi:AhpD family alkylhydroperoxidase
VADPRIDLVDLLHAPILARPWFSATEETSPIIRALAQVPELLGPTVPFLGAVLNASAIDLRTKELVILRVSARRECAYCIGAHRVAAADAGVSARESAALCGELPLEAVFDEAALELLRLVDAVAGEGDVPAPVVAAVRRRLGDHGVVEIVLVAATTLMLTRFCTSLQLPLTAATTDRLAGLEPVGVSA